jgi:Sulfotransferase family
MIDYHLLCLLTPPYSGSTAIAEFLNQCPKIGGFHQKYEGQWLVEEMHKSDRWNPNKHIDFKKVYRAWDRRIRILYPNRDVEYLVEKSPPNMLRFERIVEMFKGYSILVNNRDPYASVSSMFYRGSSIEKVDREKTITNITQKWLRRSEVLKNVVSEYNCPTLSYEEFCSYPKKILEKFSLEHLESYFSSDFRVKVKNYDSQPIRNMNDAQIERLTSADIANISKQLSAKSELVKYWDYEIK